MERLAGVEPAISALATQRLTARLQPLIFWLREGDSNLSCFAGVGTRRRNPERSRRTHPWFQRPPSCLLDDDGSTLRIPGSPRRMRTAMTAFRAFESFHRTNGEQTQIGRSGRSRTFIRLYDPRGWAQRKWRCRESNTNCVYASRVGLSEIARARADRGAKR